MHLISINTVLNFGGIKLIIFAHGRVPAKKQQLHPMQDMEARTAAIDDRTSVTCTYTGS